MTGDPEERGAKASAGLSWVKVPFKATKERILHASMLAGQSYAVTFLVWCEMQESAQMLDDGGKFEVSRVNLARDASVILAAIDAIFAALADVCLIVDGKSATFIPKDESRQQRWYAKKKTAQTASQASEATRRPTDAPIATGTEGRAARCEEAANIDAFASQIEPFETQIGLSASQSRTEIGIESLEIPLPPSSASEAEKSVEAEAPGAEVVRFPIGADVEQRCRERLKSSSAAKDRDFGPIRRLLGSGQAIPADVFAALDDAERKQARVKSWAGFAPWVLQAAKDRVASSRSRAGPGIGGERAPSRTDLLAEMAANPRGERDEFCREREIST